MDLVDGDGLLTAAITVLTRFNQGKEFCGKLNDTRYRIPQLTAEGVIEVNANPTIAGKSAFLMDSDDTAFRQIPPELLGPPPLPRYTRFNDMQVFRRWMLPAGTPIPSTIAIQRYPIDGREGNISIFNKERCRVEVYPPTEHHFSEIEFYIVSDIANLPWVAVDFVHPSVVIPYPREWDTYQLTILFQRCLTTILNEANSEIIAYAVWVYDMMVDSWGVDNKIRTYAREMVEMFSMSDAFDFRDHAHFHDLSSEINNNDNFLPL